MVIEEVITGKSKKNPDELSSLYINLINDLSFAQTYYPKSKTTIYLNHLATSVYQRIYKTKRTETNRIVHFFRTEVPLVVWEYRRFLYFAFALFWFFTAIGAVSAHFDTDFVRLIMGDSYVDMTEENILSGNPIAVYDQGSTWGTALAIIFNNLQVGAKMYFYGVFAGIGTLFVLMSNCIMLGSFQYFFHQKSVLIESMRGIWVHGAFEIFSMIVEAMAGFILGASILFPKTYSRLNSFKIGFNKSFKIFLSTIPFTIVAGILEGYVTRHALSMPVILNVLIIVGTFGFMFWYYVIYPRTVFKNLQKDAVL